VTAEAFSVGDYYSHLESARKKIAEAKENGPGIEIDLSREEELALKTSEKDEEIIKDKMEELEDLRRRIRESNPEKVGEI
jgi:hypothetical protein